MWDKQPAFMNSCMGWPVCLTRAGFGRVERERATKLDSCNVSVSRRGNVDDAVDQNHAITPHTDPNLYDCEQYFQDFFESVKLFLLWLWRGLLVSNYHHIWASSAVHLYFLFHHQTWYRIPRVSWNKNVSTLWVLPKLWSASHTNIYFFYAYTSCTNGVVESSDDA